MSKSLEGSVPDIEIRAIGFVEASRSRVEDDFWGGAESYISLTDEFEPEALQGLDEFSHVEVLFHFHKLDPATVVMGARHPRNNPAWPVVAVVA